jgi:hypothetical protein
MAYVYANASPVSSASASAALVVASMILASASPMASASATASLTGGNRSASASPMASASATASLTGGNRSASASPMASANARANLTGASDSNGMSVCDVVKEMIALWSIYDVASAPKFVIERAVNDLNASLQMVWNHAEERNYWSNETLTVTLNASDPLTAYKTNSRSKIDLPADIQNVTGPCRMASNNRPLVPLGTLGELETFADLYLDGETCAEPLAYHINRMNQAGGDPSKCEFMVTPSVTGDDGVSFNLEVVRNAPRFTVDDMNSCPLVPIPHRYVESMLLPIARYHASSFSLFSSKDLKESIDRDYQQARVALGLADPLPGKSGDNIDRRDAKPQ